MKKLLNPGSALLLFAVLLTSMFLVSCDDDDPSDKEVSLAGVWTFSRLSAEVLINDSPLFDWLKNDMGLTDDEADEFENLFIASLTDEFRGTISFNEDMTYLSDMGDERETGVWSLAGSTLSLSPATGSSIELEIIQLESGTLVFEFQENEKTDFNGDGTEENLNSSLSLTFTR
ncbi:lipocalin family protein [Roseivirga sp.]|uniref:lipocalin family protein n=1 Tax=Roseivirga sp. TaxID=1964215 RepID=UPI003B52DF3C